MSAPLDVERPQPKDTKGSCGRLRTKEIANDSTVPGQKRSLMAACELASRQSLPGTPRTSRSSRIHSQPASVAGCSAKRSNQFAPYVFDE